MFRIVTVSREYGSGAGDFAERLGQVLCWPVFDRVIGEQAAKKLEVDVSRVAPVEEREDSYLERLERAFSLGTPEVIARAPIESWTEAVYRVEREEIFAIAASPPAVIVGRGSQCLLKDRQDALHLRLYAPEADRIARVVQRSSWSREKAAAMVRSLDAARRRFLTAHFGCGDREETLYGMELNTSVISIDRAVALVALLVRSDA